MNRKRSVTGVVALLGVVPAMASATDGLGRPASTIPSADLVNSVLSVSASEVVSLSVPQTPGEAIAVTVPIAGEEYTLDLAPHSVRAPGYQLLVQIEDGSIVPSEPGIVRTLRGAVREVPGSVVAGSLLESGLKARIVFPNDSGSYWVERLDAHVAGASSDLYVVYHDDDKLPCDSRCGNEEGSLEIEGHDHGGQASGRGAACGTGLCTAEMGCDADVEYFQDHGSSVPATEAQIEAVTNTMNVQYETEVDITHVITAIIVRTSEPDPYSSTNYITLLNQFRNEWLINQGGIPRDLAQLFTGKNLGGVIGVAFDIGVVCTDSAYCLCVSDFNGNFGCATDLSAHELGHLWNADHCSCPNNTMNAFITCANDFHDTFTIPEIVAHRDTRTCLDGDGGGGGDGDCCIANGTPGCDDPECEGIVCGVDPFCCDTAWDQICADEAADLCEICDGGTGDNNSCAEAVDIFDGTTSFSTIGATTDGPGLPASCEEGFGLSLVNDIWFHYQATCTGTVTVSTCNTADYDTRLAAYEGTTCPPNDFVACNDDGAGCSGFTSIMEFEAVGGTTYKLRIGGFDGSGTGTVSISCDGDVATEACCLDGGVCADVDPATCAGAGGDSQGPGTDCAGVECSGGTEACCFSSGVCADLDVATCTGAGGENQGPGTDCDSVDCGGGDNDNCANAFDIVDGQTSFSTVGATTDGPALPPECDEGFGLSMVNDIWYHYQATCDGSVLISTCNTADFDTRLATYEGTACPPAALVGCNDDGDGCGGFTSLLEFDVSLGVTYKLRIGGFDGSGSGVVVVACLPDTEECEGDANGDGTVDPLDLGYVLARFGCPVGTGDPDCDAADVNGDGDVNPLDSGFVLARFGDCP